MNTNRKKRLSVFFISLLILTVIGTVGLTVAFATCLDISAGLWQDGTPALVSGSVYIFAVVALIAAALFSLGAASCHRKENSRSSLSGRNLFTDILAAALTLLLAATLLAQLFVIGSEDHLALLLKKGSAVYMGNAAFFHIFSLVLALPAALWFLFPLIKKQRPVGAGCFFILWLASVTLRVYFDISRHLNNPRRLLTVFSLLAILLAACFEVDNRIREKTGSWGLFFTALAVLLPAASGFSGVLLSLTGVLDEGIVVLYSMVELVMAVWFAARLGFAIRLHPAEAIAEGESEAAPASETTEEPEAVAEPETTEEAEAVAESETAEEAEAVAESETAEEAEAVAEPEITEEPEAVAEPKTAEEAEAVAESETAEEPEAVAESEITEEPEAVAEPKTAEEAEAVAESEITEEPEAVKPLTAGEVQSFYDAICRTVAKRLGEDPAQTPSPEVQDKAGAILAGIVNPEDPAGTARAVRAFLAQIRS